MKTIGIIGGLSWHSSLQMYEYINRYIAEHLGEYNCAKLVLANVNLREIFVTRLHEQEQVCQGFKKQQNPGRREALPGFFITSIELVNYTLALFAAKVKFFF